MSGDQVPLFWKPKYATIQSADCLLVGIGIHDDFSITQTDSIYRTWMVLNQTSTELRSPFRATFGGTFSRDPALLLSDLNRIIIGLKNVFPSKRLKVLLPPAHLTEFNPLGQLAVLEKNGAIIDFIDRSNFISVADWTHSELSRGNQKKYRQWHESGGKIEEVGIDKLHNVFEIIRLNRLMLGVVPSIDLNGLKNLCENFPHEYKLYLGQVGGVDASAAVVVRTSSCQNYVFFWADASTYRHLSPVVAMCVYLLDLAKKDSLKFLDLGTAQVEGVDNPGLVRFKANLGATESEKYQVSMTL